MQNDHTGETPQAVYCIGTEKKRAGREGNGESVFNGWGLPVWEDEEVLGMVTGNCCLTVWMHFMPLNCTLKNG